MENRKTQPEITMKLQSGGMIEFEKTGILPNFLVFISRELRRTWRFKLKADTQIGVLKVNGEIAFHYHYDDLGCKMQAVNDGVVGEQWEIEEMLMEFRD